MIRVLRPSGASALISARVFDDAFARNLWPAVLVERVEAAAWFDSIFGAGQPRPDDPATREAFRNAVRSFEFLCPNYDAIPLLPLLMYVRNLSGSAIRMLLIAHAPGSYGLEWALLRPLLRAGDRIVAPTFSARGVIEFLCPELLAYTSVAPHPIRPLPRPRVRPDRRPYVVSLSRIHPSKLLHRQIEALAILRERRFPDLRMRIAGPLHDAATQDLTPYARSLMAKIDRLKLQAAAELAGEIQGPRDKAEFLGEARLLMNLSVTIEESFGKAIVEANGCGVPVLGTHWDGFPETIGSAGACVRVDAAKLGVDAPAQRIADAMEALLDAPPSAEACRNQAARFHPRRVRRIYSQELELALEASPARAGEAPGAACPGAPVSGLLSGTAPLTEFSWNELFALHLRDAVRLREALNGIVHTDASEADQLRSLLILGVRAPLSRWLAGAELGAMDQPLGAHASACGDDTDFFTRVGTAASSRATLSSRLACLGLLAGTGRLEQLHTGLAIMRADRLQSWGLRYLEADALRQSGEYECAFRKCIGPEDADGWGELAAHRVRQLAAICREWNQPDLALARLRSWLDRFPDSPDSGPVWLDRCLNAAAAGPELLDEARRSLEAARLQLGASADLTEIEDPTPWPVIEERIGAVIEVTRAGQSRTTFIVRTANGTFTVKKMTYDRDPGVYYDVLKSLAAVSPPLCPRPLATAAENKICWYAIFEWIEGDQPPFAPEDSEVIWNSALNLLSRMRNCPIIPPWHVELSWLHLLKDRLADDSNVLVILNALEAKLPQGPRSLCHGDFSLQNFIRTADGLVLADWEEVGSAPAGFDAGWMLAQARMGHGLLKHEDMLEALTGAGFSASNVIWFETLGLIRMLFRARTSPLGATLRQTLLARLQETLQRCRERIERR